MEEWRQIADTQYDVSNLGNVRPNNYLGHGKTKTIIPAKDRKGYMRISLWHNGKRKTYKVHRLVAEAFIPNPLGKAEVNHISGVKTDNRVENLEWVTPSENVKRAYDTGLKEKNRAYAHILGSTIGREVLSRATEKHKCKVVAIDREGNRTVYGSQKEAAIAIGSYQANIHRALKYGRTACGYTFERG